MALLYSRGRDEVVMYFSCFGVASAVPWRNIEGRISRTGVWYTDHLLKYCTLQSVNGGAARRFSIVAGRITFETESQDGVNIVQRTEVHGRGEMDGMPRLLPRRAVSNASFMPPVSRL